MSKPARGLVLVRPAQTEETVSGGSIILPDFVREGISQYQCTIEAIGLPEICEHPEKCERNHEGPWYAGTPNLPWHPIPASLCVGAWVLVKPRSFTAASETEDLYFVRQSDVDGVFQVTD